ncbi:hypothetical protein CspeluHIS016_0206770 [Cutaneotrichosporon spelunceum]|uniref:Uncharacterized protein n=1 Tax=Cutaneotrichosporon spelunceum TaxID=1672016 RepID=A0AAD3TSE6_9TREE|nr:hypothetical protein CspeluHIS016_0206770 [Cutaneotrichosporon spelunceum]
MLENQSLLVELNIFGSSMSEPAPPRPSRAPRRLTKHVERYDRYGYIVSLPLPGQRQVLSAIVVKTDRGTRAAIDAGEYANCTVWADGEERRWRFGNVDGVLGEGEPEVMGGVGPSFRWKTKDVVDDVEQEDEADAWATTATELGTPTVPPEPAAMKIYHYFDFDEESRSFICPVCLDKCNCQYHLDKLGLRHLGGTAFKAPGEGKSLQPGETVQRYVERYIESKGGEEPPFDRVRLVNKADDVAAPPLTEEWEEWLEEQRCERLGIKSRKKQRKWKAVKGSGEKEKGGKGKEKRKSTTTATEREQGGRVVGQKGKGKSRIPASRLTPTGGKSVELVQEIHAAAAAIKKRKRTTDIAPAVRNPVPNTPAQTNGIAITSTSTSRGTSRPIFLRLRAARVHEIDSDGDSVHGYSTDDSSKSHSSSRQPTTNDFLARMTTAVAPVLPAYPLEGTEGVQGMDVDGLQPPEIGVNLTDSLLLPVLDHLPPMPGSDVDPLYMNSSLQPSLDLLPMSTSNMDHPCMNGAALGLITDLPLPSAQVIQPVAEHSRLGLTLAPASPLNSRRQAAIHCWHCIPPFQN